MTIEGKKPDNSFRTREYEKNVTAIAIADLSYKKATKTKITLSITQEDSERVKIFALKNHTTVSELLHEWIAEKCRD